jgi:3-phenylpropionate/trans-cinnamate dioxygenase ferredoxin subunit
VDDVYEGDMKSFDVGNRRILLARIGDEWYAIDDRCSHAEVSLAMGELDAEGRTVTCPMHGGVFELGTGEGVEYPAVDPVDSFRVTIADDEVFVDLD